MKPILINFNNEWDEVILRCTCGGDHFLILHVEDFRDVEDEDPWWVNVSIIDEYRAPNGFWDFLKAVWHLFRTGRYCRSEVQLSREDLGSIHDWCKTTLGKTK